LHKLNKSINSYFLKYYLVYFEDNDDNLLEFDWLIQSAIEIALIQYDIEFDWFLDFLYFDWYCISKHVSNY